ncbi:DUF3299 domain-containing protein [Marinicella sp. W31]|uniref:DUF3299 domain-containing protein n=1 Tax=Marinicella sp. W31 TaxID=3023713 RepID=UPI0037577811
MNKLTIISVFFILQLLSTYAYGNDYREILWIDLMPKEDLDALMNPPKEILDIEDGSEQDSISDDVYNALLQATDDTYQVALSSTKTVPEFENKKIKIPGFVVPLTIKENMTTEFFIVPYFGACIHYPPPPPNQTIHAKFGQGFELSDIYEAYTFHGTISISMTENELATSTYQLTIDKISAYEYTE